MVAASFASSIRSQAGLPIAIAVLVLLAVRPWTIRRRGAAGLVLVLCYLSIMPLAFAGVRAYRDSWVGDPSFGKGQPTSHPLWHNAYIGLGYLPNQWRIKYLDGVAAATVRQVKPRAQFLSSEY